MADIIARNLVNRYVLHDVLSKGNAPLQEFSEADLVVFEVPPVTRSQLEHRMLEIVQKIRASGPEVMVVSHPGLRHESNKALLDQ